MSDMSNTLSEDLNKKITSKFIVKYKSGSYNAPTIDLLRDYTTDTIFTDSDRVKSLTAKLQEICGSYGLPITIVKVHKTTLAISIIVQMTTSDISIKPLTKLKAELELFLASEIEINLTTQYDNAVQIVIKNMKRPLIGLKSILDTDEFKNSHSPLSVAAGMSVQGTPLIVDIAQAPHILIAGTTGSGKSVFVDDILVSLLFKSSPKDLRLLLIDPNAVDLISYNKIPHLLTPVIDSPIQALKTFMWVEDEMLHRYNVFSQAQVKHLDAYNDLAKENGLAKLPRIMILITEYSDLIIDSPKETNDVIDRIARMGRAAGIHLILATQLPTSKIVTPQIKSNIPCRASFTVVDSRESRIILDKTGAQRLLGSGDMIFSKSDNEGIVHAQAAYVSEKEVKKVVNYIKANNRIMV